MGEWEELYLEAIDMGLSDREATVFANEHTGESRVPAGSPPPVVDDAADEAIDSQPSTSDWAIAYNEGIDSGLSDAEAQDAADEAIAPQPSASDPNVRELQEDLKAAGFDPGPIDGIMGPQTQAAIDKRDAAEGTEGEPSEEESFAAQFGYGLVFLDHAELGPILTQAAEEGWDYQKLNAAVLNTDWYRDHESADRAFQLLESTDPASAASKIEDKKQEIRTEAQTLGIPEDQLTDELLDDMARSAIVDGWGAYQLASAVLNEPDWAEFTTSGGSDVAGNLRDIKDLANQYQVTFTSDYMDTLAQKTYLGDKTIAGIEAEFAQTAKTMFSHLGDQIDAGYTVSEIMSPYTQQISQMLEISPSEVDYMNDPRFTEVLDYTSDDGGKRLMSWAEVGKHVRGLDDWQVTNGAKTEARQFADFIGKKFGRTA
mgnify:CR=1 FL=1